MATNLTPKSAARRPSSFQNKAPTLKEGPLFKRQRGQSRTADLRKLKFQQRYACLTQNGLEYLDKKKGEIKNIFPVARMRIIEKVPDSTFQKTCCFQVGDEKDVMYFKANTEKDRKEWIESLIIAATVNQNVMLERYHVGAYGQVDLQKWSCCDAADRETPGCQKTSEGHRGQRRRLTSVSVKASKGSSSATAAEYAPKSRHNTLATSASIEKRTANAVKAKIRANSLLLDNDSIDSGYLGGSQMSITSSQSGSAVYTPQTIHKQYVTFHPFTDRSSQKELTIHESSSASPKVSETSWQCLDNSFKSTVTSMRFRGTDTLVAAFSDGSVRISDINTDNRAEAIPMISGSVGGFVDIAKHYMAVGSSSLQLVDLDNTNSRKTLRIANKDESLTYLVAFTPEGQLLSYNQHQPNVIEMWPQVDNSTFEEISSILKVEKELEIDPNTCIVHGLVVSPNHHQPWLAVISNQVKIYNYSTQEFKHCIDPAKNEKVRAAFFPTGRYIAVSSGSILKIIDMEHYSESFHSASFVNKKLSITSLACNTWPRDVHLAVGLSNGEVKVYNSLPSSCTQISPVSCLTYSKDGFSLAVGHDNSDIFVWKVPPAVTRCNTTTGVSLAREEELEVDSKGIRYASPIDGYAFFIPPGSIPEGKTVTFKYGIVANGPFGPFQFPVKVRPVSAILSIHATTETPLLKPIEIALPHIINLENSEDYTQLAVFKAKCNDFITGKNGEHIYTFNEISGEKLTSLKCQGFPYAKFSTLHCCYLCYGVYRKEDTDNALFCLVEAIPRVVQESRLLIHFCVIFFLPTCLQAIREQYPEDDYELKMQTIKFASVNEAVISLNYQERCGEWIISLQGGNNKKIYQSDVSFWDQFPSPSYLEDMCREKIYPPRFTVCIGGGSRNSDVIAEFKFPGAQTFPGGTQPINKIYLPIVNQRTPVSLSALENDGGHHRLNSTVGSESSVTTAASQLSPNIVRPTAEAFRACMCDLCSVHPAKLAMTLFSKHVIGLEELMSIQTSMKSPAKDDIVICSDILVKVYDTLNNDDKLFSPVHDVLNDIDPDVAKKFEHEKENSVKAQMNRSPALELLKRDC